MQDLQLTALVPAEMEQSQQQLIKWAEFKVASLKADFDDLDKAYLHAKKQRWASATLQRHAAAAAKKVIFYEKLLAALQAGFYIIPNFPIDLFAIRTDRGKPLPMVTFGNKYYNGDKEQDPKELSVGEGDYKNPFPVIMQKGITTDEIEYWAKDWKDIEFPISMAKPQIMEATSQAMALKIFDQIGIMPATRKEDPIIIGQIKRKESWNSKVISFMIAWHLNTNML